MGIQVISGLALGVDGASHRGALEAGKPTYGVLGCGINICYPKENYPLFEKMEKEGYILGYQAQVNPEALGYHIKALINLEVSPEEKNVFYPFVRKCSNVIECNCVTGEYSMVLEVLFPSTTELDKFIGELQRFGRTKTLIVFSTSVEHRGINADIEETLEREI